MAGLSSIDDAAIYMKKTCSEKHLAKIAFSISVDWREISPFLDLTAADEREILGAIPPLSVRSQKIAMLRMWKKKQGANATYERLCQAFSDCEMTDLVDKIQDLLAVNSNNSSNEEGLSSNLSSPDPIITSYASYLKELYTSMSHSHTSQHWAHLPRCEFVQLAMIKNEMVRRGGPEEEMIRLAQQGKIETILCHKEPIDFADLFPFSPGRVCLIEGAPGGGKSTLALHICHQWAKGASSFARFDVVILAYLRDEAVQNARVLAEVLPAHNREISQQVASQLQSTNGKNVLFVFDGWDEFPQNLMNNSLVSTIIRQPHKLSLHQSTVLITSRPVASGNLLHIVDRRVEILGFNQQQIREYIKKALNGNSSQIQQLVQHLEEHPVIEGYCYIPLHSAVLVHIFLTMKGVLPTTHHELFCSLVLCCIVRELETHEPNIILPEMSSLNDLPDDLKSKLNNLGLLAYNGVMEEKIIFYLEDLQRSHLPANLPSLGLLQTTEGLTLYSKSLSYNFLHLSVQELLAAYHISKMDSSKQAKIFRKLFGSSRFEAVLHYYCGFTKLDNPEVQKFISSYQSNLNSVIQMLPLLHCLFEAKQPSLSQLVNPTMFMQDGNFCYQDEIYTLLTPVDYIAIGYFIVSFLSTCGPEFITPMYLKLKYFGKDHCLKLLLNELSKNPTERLPMSADALTDKLVLQLSGPSLAELKYIATFLKRFPLICELKLKRIAKVNVQSVVGELLLQMLHMNNSVTKLSLQYCPARYPSITITIKYTHLNKSLTELTLSSLPDALLNSIFKHIQHNTTLVKLSLGYSNTTAETARTLLKTLVVNKSLTHLVLSNSVENFSDYEAFCVFIGLQQNATLTNLDLSNCDITATDPDTARALTKMLQVNTSLTHLDLSCEYTVPANRIISIIFSALEHKTTLLHLVLRGREILEDDAKCIAQTLKSNRSLVTIDFSLAYISRVDIILAALKFNTTLERMCISYHWGAYVAVEELRIERKKSGLPTIDIVIMHLNFA